MANQLYPKAKQALLSGQVDLLTSNVKVALSRSTFNAAHATLDQIADIVATSPNLTTKTVLDGVFDSDDVTFVSVATAAAAQYLVLYVDSGTPSTSRLIAHIDTATGLPVTPDGTNITVEVNAAGWFTL